MQVKELIQPVNKGQDLIKEIDRTVFDGEGVAVWWVGQSGFILKSKDATVYVDPYLSEHLTMKYADTSKPHIRMTEAPIRGENVHHADLLLSTHKHSDHMDPVTTPEILSTSPQCSYIIPRAHHEHVLSWGVDASRLVLADVDQSIQLCGVEIIPIPAAHESLDYIENIGYPHMSYIIKLGGLTFYHSGDGIPYTGLVERLIQHKVDIAFLPINGRDMRRHALGTPGNFTIEEALCTATLAGIDTLIPHHYEMFTFNTVDISEFEDWSKEFYPKQKVCVMSCGEKHIFHP